MKTTTNETPSKRRRIYSIMAWSFIHYPDRSEIWAHVEITGKREIIAVIPNAKGIDAKAVAEFIVCIVNDHEKSQKQMREAIAALELCLATNGLTWEAEQAADAVVSSAR